MSVSTAAAALTELANGAHALPALRDDLQLYEGPPAADGAPTWTIGDPVRGRYFHIGYVAFQLLSQWHLGLPQRVLAAANAVLTEPADGAAIDELLYFLRANNLIAGHAPGQIDSYLAQVRATRVSWLHWLLHNYLFIRIPLVRPDRFLRKTLPWIEPLFSSRFLAIMAAIGSLGLFLIARRWDEFTGTFLYFFSWQGAALLAVTVTFAKVIHELGHAYMARRFGCRVHSMGVAFMVMMPVLFTDVSDAWRLPSRRQRLLIDAGGMLAELCLAVLATLLWSFLPEGPLRSAAFMLATVTWVTTILVNVNPLMRFDGYFLLSDWLGVQNMQPRGFALARWRLRETLFGFGEPPPEVLPKRQYRALLLWAYSTWIYRFVLFLGIALLVYHAFFKALGIVLMAVEIGWFIVAPLLRELREWWQRRAQLRNRRRGLCFGGAVLGGLALLALPWQSHVTLPAILEAAEHSALYPPVSARIAAVHAAPGSRVEAGQVLYVLAAPDLEFKLARATQALELTQLQILRQAASRETLGQLGVLESQLAADLAEVRGLRAQRERLTVRAAAAGVLVDVPVGLRPGLWLAETAMLGRVVQSRQLSLRAYARATDLDRIQAGARGRFYADDPARPSLPVRVVKIEGIGVATLDIPYLTSTHGGPVAVREDRSRGAVPNESVYRLVLTADAADAVAVDVAAPDVAATNAQHEAARRRAETEFGQVLRGAVRIEAQAISPLTRLWRWLAGTLIRESGF